jgi:hypothetical protein
MGMAMGHGRQKPDSAILIYSFSTDNKISFSAFTHTQDCGLILVYIPSMSMIDPKFAEELRSKRSMLVFSIKLYA